MAKTKDWALALLSLKHSSAVSAFLLNRQTPSHGMSMSLAWKSRSQVSGAKSGVVMATEAAMALPTQLVISIPDRMVNFAASFPSLTACSSIAQT